MRSVIARRGQQASLPIGWHRRFLICFFGNPNSKGLYTTWPGPVPDLFVCLSFLGLTFIRLQSENEAADWIKCFWVPGKDQSWTGPTLEALADEESSDANQAMIKADARGPAPQYVEEKQTRREESKSPSGQSEGIQPDEVIEFDIEPQDEKPKKTQTRRHSEHHPNHRRDEFPEHRKRQPRYSMSSMPGRNGFEARNHTQYFMETTSTDGPPDSSAFNTFDTFDTFDDTATEFTPLPENPRYRARRNMRRSSMNSSTSIRSAQSDSFPISPASPHENPADNPGLPSPRNFRRRTNSHTSPTSPTNRFRSLSPIADYHPRRVPSPTNTEPVYHRSESSYMPTPESSNTNWSDYTPHVQPAPRSPGSTVSYASSRSYVPGSAPEAAENVNGDFTVQAIRSFSESAEGRFYKVRWANTWESKTSMRAATESGKYTVKEVLESRYVNGKGLYHVRWQDTWESEQELGDIDPVRVYWQEVAAGRRPQGHRQSFA
ncbi:hypothetical protein TWF225_002256 [Orbilia oligospora]|uniref:Uncharacterized protein n=1 Tax=Orbilia oligospora TaxID=2813651 RepID=A0A7C8KFB2_ORBOL|nr:hypothetical protein TWF751_006331 [Orbilia oligospora]KAF3190512.1 hypothetical protein TWF225_002256 [Orbilia oligospora]KAF3236368.1 hypothetical protein TWF128_001384 [Orbilia oligospora]KAF3242196.1 hypothetical protein TWF217_011837 [Orbilia oligospora]KAF3280382.1 hypothetical protein TWF132_011755 [Orbilia oligospora]